VKKLTLPILEPLKLSSANPGLVADYNFNIKLAQLTGTNGPRDLYSAYNVDFFEKYAAAFASALGTDVLTGYDGSQYHQSISISAREYLRRCGTKVVALDSPVTVPEFMFSCYKLGLPGCFFGRSHSPQQYVGLKLVINAKSVIDLLEKSGATINNASKLANEKIYGFLPRTLAPPIEEKIGDHQMIHPINIGQFEEVDAKELRNEFVKSLKNITPMAKLEGSFIVDCRHSMAGEVWDIIKTETKAEIILHNNKLNPTAYDRDPREIWDQLSDKYYNSKQAVFDHDADADRTFLVKIPGIGREKIIENQEESFTTGLLAEAQVRKPDAYILVQERISLIMLSALANLTNKVYATAQGEPAFFMGVSELLLKNPAIGRISGADYTDIYFSKEHPICMKSPYQQALWMMHWFKDHDELPQFASVDVAKTQIDMLELNYPQRLEKVLKNSEKIIDFFKGKFEIIYQSTLDGQNFIMKDGHENLLITSIRPSGTGRYTKVFSEIGLGKSSSKERKEIAENVNKEIVKIIEK